METDFKKSLADLNFDGFRGLGLSYQTIKHSLL
jgi:hypothetical protein